MQLAAVVHFIDALGHAAEKAFVVHLLEDAAGAFLARHLTHQQDDGKRVLVGHVDSDGGIGGAGATADHEDGRLARKLGFAARHETGSALMAADNHLDAAGMERVQQREIALAGHAIDPLYPVGLEGLNNQSVLRACRFRAMEGLLAPHARNDPALSIVLRALRR